MFGEYELVISDILRAQPPQLETISPVRYGYATPSVRGIGLADLKSPT
jgi:hypothetical protein